MVCDGYDLPFVDGSLSHLVAFDVFHHLRAPNAFLREAHRVLTPGGRLILFEPYISLSSYPVYGLLHHEPVALWQGNNRYGQHAATSARLLRSTGKCDAIVFSERDSGLAARMEGVSCAGVQQFQLPAVRRGYSKPSLYPVSCLKLVCSSDAMNWLSRWPRLFGARCLVGLGGGGHPVVNGARTPSIARFPAGRPWMAFLAAISACGSAAGCTHPHTLP